MPGQLYRTIFASHPVAAGGMMRCNVREFFTALVLPIRARRWLLLLAALSIGWGAWAGAVERRAFEVAVNMFHDGSYGPAEKEFADFIKNHPDSEKVPEAALLQAQCRYQQKQIDAALALLRERLANAGKLADQYRYWIAECVFEKGDHAGASTAFAQVLSDFPNSSRRLDASLGEAYARFKLGDLRRTVELLDQPQGAFQQAAQNRMDDDLVVRGHLLLGEAYLGLRQFQKGKEALGRLAERVLRPELNWQRLYLLARLQLAGQEWDASWQTTTNLLGQLSAITNVASLNWQADTAALQGEIREQQGQTESAIQAYERNLSTNTPSARRQQALQQIVRLTLAQNRIGEAGKRLESYVTQYPKDGRLDLLRLTLGELRLKEYYELPEEARKSSTNLVPQIKAHFEQIIANTNSQLTAKAHLDRGWCLWEQGRGGADTNRISESLLAFRAAAGQLPRSPEQAVARFKLADCQFALADYAGSVTNYWLVVSNYADLPRVQSDLVGQALYQIVRAGIQLGNLASADQAVQRILADYPPDELNDRSLLLYGQAKSRLNNPARARDFFADFIRKLPESPVLPEVELAVARTYEQEEDWPKAVDLYDRWVSEHTDHASLPDAEFDRAWADYRAGNETNAFRLFTGYVERFPTNALALQAQYWVADCYFRLGGTNYVKAEESYEKVFLNTNWAPSELSYQAEMMAGRAAYARQGYNDAAIYFTRLINKLTRLNPPPALLPEAYYALADTYIAGVPGSTNALNSYKDAIGVLEKITREYPTNALAPLAWGRMGNCYFQLGAADTNNYPLAVSAYKNAMTNDRADVTCRSIAEVGLAKVLEKQAEQASPTERTNLLSEALRHYLYVANGRNLREQEVADPFWVKKAAEEAALLAEAQQQWEVAANLYRRLITNAPSLRKIWELKLEKLDRLRSQ